MINLGERSAFYKVESVYIDKVQCSLDNSCLDIEELLKIEPNSN